jgi:hypothetical protein
MIFGPKGPFCQSCGMPLSKDPQGGGTNSDGTSSVEYCSRCYQNGQFTDPNMTMEQMRGLVKDKLVEMGFPRFAAGFFTKNIPHLKRWKNT